MLAGHLQVACVLLWLCLALLAAAIGRGMSKFALRTRILQSSLEQMLEAAALPILSDVQLQVSGPHYVQLFPDPLPDVFVGQPLLVSGKYAGPWGKDALLTGLMPTGERELKIHSKQVVHKCMLASRLVTSRG